MPAAANSSIRYWRKAGFRPPTSTAAAPASRPAWAAVQPCSESTLRLPAHIARATVSSQWVEVTCRALFPEERRPSNIQKSCTGPAAGVGARSAGW